MNMTDRKTATRELLARIHEVGPILRENAAKADKDRRIPEASIAALKKAGVFAINAPKEYGGSEAGARAMVEAAVAIGTYCTNSAWISVISGISTVLPTRFPKSLCDRMFADGPSIPMASVINSPASNAVREGDGYRVSGEWPWASNIWHSDWALGVVMVQRSPTSPPEPGFAFFEKHQWTVKDIWYTVGMRGTGSNVFVVKDEWIPADQVVLAGELIGPKFESSEASSFPQRLAPVSTFGTTIAAPAIGAARAALGLTVNAAKTRPMVYSTYAPQNTSGAFAQGIGQAKAKIDTSEMFLLRAADMIDAAAMGTVPLSPEQRASIRADVGHATHNLCDAMNDIAWLHGSSFSADANPISRLWRDVNTGSRHALAAGPLNYEIGGASILGVSPPADLV